jgi:hypothetical protein
MKFWLKRSYSLVEKGLLAKQALVLVDAKAKKVLANPCTRILKACLTRRQRLNYHLTSLTAIEQSLDNIRKVSRTIRSK